MDNEAKFFFEGLNPEAGEGVDPQGRPHITVNKPDETQPKGVLSPGTTPGSMHVDQTKDVPLAASALHKDGQFYGIAVDKDAPKTDLGIKGWSPFHGVYLHEQSEFAHMKNLIAGGMQPQEAYHEAHDKIATPTETAYVRAIAKQNGKDPDKFLDEYKQYWRDVAGNASVGPFDRHPDAHTTTFGLDESELPPEAKKHLKDVVKQQQDTAKGLIQHLVEPFAEIGHAIVGDEDRWANLGKGMVDLASPEKGVSPSLFMGALGARTFSHEAANKFLLGEMKGHSVNRLWRETGTFRGAEGTLRQEIPDEGSKLKVENLHSDTKREYHGVKENSTLEDILHHPKLFEAYPELKDMEVYPILDPWNLNSGEFNPRDFKIGLAPDFSEDMLSTLLHEVQHAIQHLEGFKQGASPESVEPYVAKALEAAMTKSKFKETDLPFKLDPKSVKEFIKDQSYLAYRKVAGEAEARNVQTRQNFTEGQRSLLSPRATSEIPFERQLNPPSKKGIPAERLSSANADETPKPPTPSLPIKPPPSVKSWLNTDAPMGLKEHLESTGQVPTSKPGKHRR